MMSWEARANASEDMGAPIPRPTGSDLAWGESYKLSAMLMQFERSRSVDTLNDFFTRVDAVFASRDDRSRRFTGAATWSTPAIYSPLLVCSNVGLDGMILNPISRFLVLAKERPEIFPYDVTSRRQAYVKAIKETLAYHQLKSWNASLGTYREHADCEEVDSLGRRILNFDRLPFNLIAAMGRVQMNLYLATGDSQPLKAATSIAKDLRLWFIHGYGGAIYWPYLYADTLPDDSSHGAIVADFIKLLADHGVVFNQTTVDGLDATVRYQILGGSSVVMTYIGARRDSYKSCFGNTYYDCRDLALWLPVIPYNNWTVYAKSFIHPDSGSFGLLAKEMAAKYTRTKGYGASCSDDAECFTGSCYAGRICGYKLGYGSTCVKDSDCASGSCYGGRTCGMPLGSGSSCTRHHECVSGECMPNSSGLKICK